MILQKINFSLLVIASKMHFLTTDSVQPKFKIYNKQTPSLKSEDINRKWFSV